ncbi:MAG TPA: TolC family protein [Rubricoccaceae bacterium]|nr:TolC family protein [Rubricoccaceae bacterium]
MQKALTVGLAALLAAAGARAQAPRVLTLDEVAALAQTQAVAVRRAALEVEAREAALAGARGQRLPALGLYSNGAQRYGLSFDETAGQVTQSTTEFASAGAELSWTVFDGFATASTVAGARADRAEAERLHERARQTAVHEALRLYYEVATAGAAREIAEENAAAQAEQHRLVAAQIREGLRPQTEIHLQEERLAEAELAVLQAERAERAATLALVRHLALDPAGDYAVAAPGEAEPAAVAALDEAALVAEALDRRADLRAYEAAADAARASRRAAGAGRWPSLALVAGYGTSYTSTDPTGLGAQLDQNRGGSVGFRIGFPLFDQRQTSAQVRAAEARFRQREVEAEDARRQVALDVREAVLDLRLRGEEVRVAEQRVAAAEAALAAERERYRLGLTTLAALAEVNARYVEARVGEVRAAYALRVQQALLAYQVGR